MMNGGLCERIFDQAKQHLDARDDPERPTVELSAQDVRAACRSIPPPPEAPPASSCAEGQHRPSGGDQPPPVLPQVVSQRLLSAAAATDPGAAGRGIPRPAAGTAAGGVGLRNVWFCICEASGLPKKTLSCVRSSARYTVSVRLDRQEAHRTSIRRSATGCPKFQETRILSYRGESLLEFVITRRTSLGKDEFIGTGTVALPGLDSLDAEVELIASDRAVGALHVQVGWQYLASMTGASLFHAWGSDSLEKKPQLGQATMVSSLQPSSEREDSLDSF